MLLTEATIQGYIQDFSYPNFFWLADVGALMQREDFSLISILEKLFCYDLSGFIRSSHPTLAFI